MRVNTNSRISGYSQSSPFRFLFRDKICWY